MKEEIISELLKTFSVFNRTLNFVQFQKYMKGENLFMQKLDELGGESTPTVISREMGFSSPRVAAMLRSLEMKKLIRRSSSPSDRRKIVVRITPKGRDWVRASNDETLNLVNGLMDKLGEEDSKELVRIMRKLLCVEDGEKPGAEPPAEENGGDAQ